MPKRIKDEELRVLRNDLDITAVIDHLHIPFKIRDGHFRFLCPLCANFHTATNRRTNLARCFGCKKNYNPIDLVMVDLKMSFLETVHYLREHAPLIHSTPIHRIAREEHHQIT